MQAMKNQAIRQCFQLLIFKPISTVTQGKSTTFHLTQHRRTRTFESYIIGIASIVLCVDTTSWIAVRKSLQFHPRSHPLVYVTLQRSRSR
jgi:hypothetical protein